MIRVALAEFSNEFGVIGLSEARHQVVLLVVHLGRVSPHAVDGQEQVHEGKRRVQPQQVRPGARRQETQSANSFPPFAVFVLS